MGFTVLAGFGATFSKAPAKTAALPSDCVPYLPIQQPGHGSKCSSHNPTLGSPWVPGVSFGPFPQLESRFWGDQRLWGHRALVTSGSGLAGIVSSFWKMANEAGHMRQGT